ncbi:hypothetical protein ON010_g18540 [Phytophthora cinnamomi]|nr:hypothetical protein ON010_g18540 [Phytophthora cinnamomi]
MLTEKKRPVVINVAKKFTGKKRNQVEATSAEPGSCFYCFEDGHQTGWSVVPLEHPGCSECEEETFDGSEEGTHSEEENSRSEVTTAEAHAHDQQLAKAIEEADEFAFDENVPAREGEEAEDKAFNPMDIGAKVTGDLWVVDTGAGHAVKTIVKGFRNAKLLPIGPRDEHDKDQ